MGVILDSSVLIAGERRSHSVLEILERVETVCGGTSAALSAVTAVELTHGIYRARTEPDRKRREAFVEELFRAIPVHPLTLDVARLAGRIHGEQMGRGVAIDFADLVIGATALHLGFGIVTLNVRHFQIIPGLSVMQLQ
jgi:predicted nucleic acid-binding protein